MKRIFGTILALVLICNTMSVSAVNNDICKDSVSYPSEMLIAIEQDRERMYKDLVSQLEAQNALDQIDNFMFLIEDSINAKYFPNATTEMTIYAPYGGWYTRENSSISMETRYYSVPATAALGKKIPPDFLDIAGVLATFITPENIVQVVSKTIAVLSGLKIANAFINYLYWEDIKLGVDSVMVVATYDKLDLKTTTVTWEWINSPYMKFSDSDLVAYGTFTKAEDNDLIEELESQ